VVYNITFNPNPPYEAESYVQIGAVPEEVKDKVTWITKEDWKEE
jgi:hypothetical protein